MTVIAWDGKTLAADRRVSTGTYGADSITKIHRWKGGLCGYAGTLSLGNQMVAWLKAGAKPDDFPTVWEEQTCELMVIDLVGRIYFYESIAAPYILENKQHAIGSGAAYARAAMYLGHPAAEAVEVAIALDSGCGNGIDTLTLDSRGRS